MCHIVLNFKENEVLKGHMKTNTKTYAYNLQPKRAIQFNIATIKKFKKKMQTVKKQSASQYIEAVSEPLNVNFLNIFQDFFSYNMKQ